MTRTEYAAASAAIEFTKGHVTTGASWMRNKPITYNVSVNGTDVGIATKHAFNRWTFLAFDPTQPWQQFPGAAALESHLCRVYGA